MANNSTTFNLGDGHDLEDTFLLLGEEEGLFHDSTDDFSSFLNDINMDETPQENNEVSSNMKKISSTSVHDNVNKTPPQVNPMHANNTMNAVHMEVQENAKISTFLQPVDRSNSGHVNILSRYQGRKSKSKLSKSRSSKQTKTKEKLKKIFRAKTAEDESALPDFLQGIDFNEDSGSSSSGSFNLSEMFLGSSSRSNAADTYKNAGAHGYQYLPNSLNKVPTNIVTSSLKQPDLANRNIAQSSGLKSSKSPHTQVQRPFGHAQSYNYYPYGRNEMLPITSASTRSVLNSKNSSASPPNPGYLKNNIPKHGVKPILGTTVPNPILGNPSKIPIPGRQQLLPIPVKQGIRHDMERSTAYSKRPVPLLTKSTSTSLTPPPVTKKKRLKKTLIAPQNPTLTHQQSSAFLPKQNLVSQSTGKMPSTYVYRSSTSNNLNTPQYSRSSTLSVPSKSRGARSRSNSFLEPTTRQNQFGFGGNHTVPSVPHPPPSRQIPKATRTNTTAIKKAAEKATKPTYRQKIKGKVAEYSTVKELPVNKAAYERKKQRAKDSRVRLNEAIEKLSLSISVTGIQSEKRRNMNLGFKSSTIDIMGKCVKTSKEAKKWDRPSFIDTAATLIQHLNEQCEAMEKEIEELHHKSDNPQKMTEDTKELENKKVKLSTTATAQYEQIGIDTVFNYCTILVSLASFLDPFSLQRCVQVSKGWNSREIFKSDEVWTSLCRSRFGSGRIASWLHGNGKNLQNAKKIEIYRKMHEANVQPICEIEGNVSLGEGKVKGVSTWASMLERSNGETIRSVIVQAPQNKKRMQDTNEEASLEFKSLPVVELRVVIQNTGSSKPIIVPDQDISVDAGTRRKGEEMIELKSDRRLAKSSARLDGTNVNEFVGNCISLELFDSIVLVTHIHARGCSTASKFRKKANFMKILVKVNDITIPVVVPFAKEDESKQEKKDEEM